MNTYELNWNFLHFLREIGTCCPWYFHSSGYSYMTHLPWCIIKVHNLPVLSPLMEYCLILPVYTLEPCKWSPLTNKHLLITTTLGFLKCYYTTYLTSLQQLPPYNCQFYNCPRLVVVLRLHCNNKKDEKPWNDEFYNKFMVSGKGITTAVCQWHQ